MKSVTEIEKPSSFRIVGIGASAGGLESLEQLFANIPPHTGMAFVVIQHLSPDFKSMMDELLSRHSDMPVQLAEHEVEVEPNHIYLLPPGKEMTIQRRRLHLTERERTHSLTLPIDQFFRSLAQDVGSNAVAIVLSGSGSDGSRGVRDIKRHGGVVIAESPDTARFDGMPLSALATGMVDHAATAKNIPRFLLDHADVGEAPEEAVVNESPMDSVLRLLRDKFGLDFSLYKTTTVSRRVLRRVDLHGASSLEDYVDRLRTDPNELSALYHDLLIGVTRFFRDPEAFELLEKTVLQDLLLRVPENEEIRVWVAACATGEEAYSVAMLLFEQLTSAGRQLNVKILSTDVHTASLSHASAGLYGEEQLEHVSERRRERFFTKKPGGYQISHDLRQLIVFAPHNVTKDAPFTRMHLITCRNFLIYLEPPAQKAVLSLLHFGLATGGYLFLGSSESPGSLAHEFDTIDEHWKIYRKKRDVRLLEPVTLRATRKTAGSMPSFLNTGRSTIADTHLLATYDQLLDRTMPPSFLVDEDRELLDTFGGAERFFRLGKRRPSTNILDLLEGELRTVVAGAVQRALTKENPVRYTGVPLTSADNPPRCVLSAEVFTNPRTGANHVLITLEKEAEDRKEPTTPEKLQKITIQVPQDRLDTLEGELSYTRETLQSTIEELQTSNEELQAANEELVASNEELQSTNEELHSVNEELYTVNAEHQRKIVELRELNSDMQHFLESADVGTLFLDKNLRIRKYTPRIAGLFHIQPQDVGRTIRDFSHNLRRTAIQEELERALLEGTVVEDEVRDADGTTYFLRILPHRVITADIGQRERGGSASIEGVILSLTDISALEHARSRLRQLSAIVESSDDAIIGKTLEGTIVSWNRGAQRLYGYAAEEVVGRNISILAPPGHVDEMTTLLEALGRGQSMEHIDSVRIRKDGTLLDVSITISPIIDAEGQMIGASSIARDVTQLKKVQRDLMEREARIRLLLDSTAEAIFGFGTDGICTFCNLSCARLLGYSSVSELIGRDVHPLIHRCTHGTSLEEQGECSIFNVLRTGQGTHTEEKLWRADGSSFLSEYWSYPIRSNGTIVGVVVTFLDITTRKQAEEEILTASRRREQFLAMLSHELRNPLAAVLSAARVVRAVQSEPHMVSKAHDIIERQAAHMARLLDDLLDVSRITRGGIELRKEDLDLRDVIQAALEALTPMLEERSVPITVDLPKETLPVRGDPARLQQVVVNLVSNAARYSQPDTPISLTARSNNGSIVISVRDEGRGISREMLSDIFELFVQAEQGLERSRGGLGIGLSLVRMITELHSGTVEAQSDGVGKGSTFVVRLPRQEHALLRHSAAADHDGPSRRVVVVEDQDDTREMLRVLLELGGHIVLEESNGRDAITTIEREHPDIALIDIGLPLLNGYEVARSLRQNPALDDVLLVALTGYGMDQDIVEAHSAGFDDHLTKPTDLERLEQLIARRGVRKKAS